MPARGEIDVIRTPTNNYNDTDNKKYTHDDSNSNQSLQMVQQQKKKMVELEQTVKNQRDKIEALEFENDELLNANNILKEQVASHLTKIQRISRTAVKPKELNEMFLISKKGR